MLCSLHSHIIISSLCSSLRATHCALHSLRSFVCSSLRSYVFVLRTLFSIRCAHNDGRAAHSYCCTFELRSLYVVFTPHYVLRTYCYIIRCAHVKQYCLLTRCARYRIVSLRSTILIVSATLTLGCLFAALIKQPRVFAPLCVLLVLSALVLYRTKCARACAAPMTRLLAPLSRVAPALTRTSYSCLEH
jgi:hypothetical protein